MQGILGNIETPAILIEKKIMERNLRAMQSLADLHGINLRVHIKTHKIPELAKLQLKSGAVGIAVAKLGEAEIMADAGIRDLQIANIIVGENKFKRLRRLHRKCRLTVAIDSIENAMALSNKFKKERTPLSVLIKINSGLNRSGLDSFRDVLNLAKIVSALKGLKIIGLMTHAGHAYGASNLNEIKHIGKSEGTLLVEYAQSLKRHGFDMDELSAGSTPTAPFCSHVPGLTEVRVGNYIFNDRTQVALDTVPQSRCALTVLATVISRHSKNRVVIDAGSKALALDMGAHGKSLLKGYGLVLRTNDTITRLSEEHGIIDKPRGKYKIGMKIRIIPNHACTVMNLFDEAFLVNGNEVLGKYRIAARGKMT
ncbi:Low-specificity D-threonine aldolase [Candidatus Zixiibacteriota bacterium]|nr:Low-specificity D-threonine aldolase [candidate division Zixibacteria bacterium]